MIVMVFTFRSADEQVIDYLGCSEKAYIGKWNKKYNRIKAENCFSMLVIKQLVILVNDVNEEIERQNYLQGIAVETSPLYEKELFRLKEALAEALNLHRTEVNFLLFGREL